MANMAEALPTVLPEVPLPPELKGALETAQKIASLDFTGVRDSTDKTVEKKSVVSVHRVNNKFVLVGSGDQAEKVTLLTFLETNLPDYVSKLPPEKVQTLKDQGILKEEGGQLVLVENVGLAGKITLLAAVADQIKETGLGDHESLLREQGVATGDFLTGLQALAVSLAQSAYDQYQPSATPEETREITYTKKKAAAEDRFKMSVAFGREWEDDSLEIAVEREMIFKVKRDEKAVDDQGKEVTFENLLDPVREAVKQGDFDTAVTLATTTKDGFSKTLERRDPDSREKTIGRLKKIMAMRLSSKEMASSNDGPALHALLGKDNKVFNNGDFEEALTILFPFEKQLPGLNSQDEVLRRKAAGQYYRDFYELGAVIFGTKGLQRLVEVDLHTAVGLQDILLTPEARLKRLELEEKAVQARQKLWEQSSKNQDPELLRVLNKLALANSGFDQAVKDLEAERQKQKKAILTAFSVKFEDGAPVVGQKEITPEIQQLADDVNERYEMLMTSGQSGILEANRRMIQTMLHASLDKEKIEQLNQRLSEQGFGPRTEAILQELDINKDYSDYELVRRIIADGRRVAGSLIRLGRRVKDPYSQVEDLTMTGDLFDMGLKGVEYLHRHGQFDEEPVTKTITLPGRPGEKPAVELPQQVLTYRVIQTEATGQAPTLPEPELGEGIPSDKILDELDRRIQPEETDVVPTITHVEEPAPKEKPPLDVEKLQVEIAEREQKITELQEQFLPKEELKRLKKEIEELPLAQQSLVEEIYQKGLGRESYVQVADLTQADTTSTLIYQEPGADGKIEQINLLDPQEGLLNQRLTGTEKDSQGKPIGRRMFREALLFSPQLSRELMQTLRSQVKLEQQLTEDKNRRKQISNLRKQISSRRKQLPKAPPAVETPTPEITGLPAVGSPQEAVRRIVEQAAVTLPAGRLTDAQLDLLVQKLLELEEGRIPPLEKVTEAVQTLTLLPPPPETEAELMQKAREDARAILAKEIQIAPSLEFLRDELEKGEKTAARLIVEHKATFPYLKTPASARKEINTLSPEQFRDNYGVSPGEGESLEDIMPQIINHLSAVEAEYHLLEKLWRELGLSEGGPDAENKLDEAQKLPENQRLLAAMIEEFKAAFAEAEQMVEIPPAPGVGIREGGVITGERVNIAERQDVNLTNDQIGLFESNRYKLRIQDRSFGDLRSNRGYVEISQEGTVHIEEQRASCMVTERGSLHCDRVCDQNTFDSAVFPAVFLLHRSSSLYVNKSESKNVYAAPVINIFGTDALFFTPERRPLALLKFNEGTSENQVFVTPELPQTADAARAAGHQVVQIGEGADQRTFVVVAGTNNQSEKALAVFEEITFQIGDQPPETKLIFIDGRRTEHKESLIERVKAKTGLADLDLSEAFNTLTAEPAQKPISAMSLEELTTALESGQATEGQITEEIIRLKNNRDIPAFLIENEPDRLRAQALEKSLREREQEAQKDVGVPDFLKGGQTIGETKAKPVSLDPVLAELLESSIYDLEQMPLDKIMNSIEQLEGYGEDNLDESMWNTLAHLRSVRDSKLNEQEGISRYSDKTKLYLSILANEELQRPHIMNRYNNAEIRLEIWRIESMRQKNRTTEAQVRLRLLKDILAARARETSQRTTDVSDEVPSVQKTGGRFTSLVDRAVGFAKRVTRRGERGGNLPPIISP